jgi:predicted phosphodiesterase
MNITRRSFNSLGAASLGAALAPSWMKSAAAPLAASTTSSFHFAVVSDAHVIDPFYKPGSENGVEDNESILRANDRLAMARDTINGIRFKDGSKVEQIYLPGDVFHNYPSADYDFYFKNETRIDIAKKILDGFDAPVHMCWGNHDYDVPRVSREMSHQLFKEKLKTEPYYSVDHNGFRFVHLNNFLGVTWDKSSPSLHKDTGSLGETQLQWAEAQLAVRKPTVVFVHYPLLSIMPTEVKDFGLHPLLRKYQDTILVVISGHVHKWIDYARTFGPPHMITAATRYDPNSFMIFQADPKKGTVDWVDRSRAEWATHYSTPYRT